MRIYYAEDSRLHENVCMPAFHDIEYCSNCVLLYDQQGNEYICVKGVDVSEPVMINGERWVAPIPGHVYLPADIAYFRCGDIPEHCQTFNLNAHIEDMDDEEMDDEEMDDEVMNDEEMDDEVMNDEEMDDEDMNDEEMDGRKSYGILHFEDGKAVFGYFIKDNTKAGYVRHNGSWNLCQDVTTLPDYFKEDYCSGAYVNSRTLSEKEIKELSEKRPTIQIGKTPYNSDDVKQDFQSLRDYIDGKHVNIDKDLKLIDSYINDVTFGLEFETINGNLPPHLAYTLGLIICKDGSTKNDNDNNVYPPEFVTVPLRGAKGLQIVRNICKELSLRSDINIKCSLHVHIGGFKVDRLFLVSLYKLCHKIQDEVFDMFPGYKVKWQGYKKQNYCKKLPRVLSDYGTSDINTYINSSYEDLYYTIVDETFSKKYNRKNKKHNFGAHKWNIPSRYYWVNFVNLFLNNRNTVEFRLHTPTLNADKSINWLLMCIAIVKYAQSNIRKCLSSDTVSFTSDVLNYYMNKQSSSRGALISKRLIDYYKERKEVFEKDIKAGDLCSNHELINDSKYSFKLINIEL